MARKSPAAPAVHPATATATTPRDKAVKFRELATKRVNRTVHAIRLIANLSNRGSYEYTDEQVLKLMTALGEAVDYVGGAFSKGIAKSKDLQF